MAENNRSANLKVTVPWLNSQNLARCGWVYENAEELKELTQSWVYWRNTALQLVCLCTFRRLRDKKQPGEGLNFKH